MAQHAFCRIGYNPMATIAALQGQPLPPFCPATVDDPPAGFG
jgi:acyl-[acyl carrier protein]--UDP-N-acetylglucosamine O-acyltransferase